MLEHFCTATAALFTASLARSISINQHNEYHDTKKLKAVGGGVAVALLLLAFSTNSFAQAAQNVSVTNQDSEAVTLTLNASDGGHMMTVGVDSTAQETVISLISITINGQTLAVGQDGDIMLPDNSYVYITWGNAPTVTVPIIVSAAVV